MRSVAPNVRLALMALLCICLVWVGACQKYADTPGVHDPRLDTSFYCNNPDAVNYNWHFPGTPDSTVCFYPSDVFKGNYVFTDSIYDGNNKLLAQQAHSFGIVPINRSRIAIIGFCGGATDSIKLTANRTFHAQVDTTVINGQLFCRPLDTLSGYLSTSVGDTVGIHFFFTVVSDTGTTYHRGTAVKH